MYTNLHLYARKFILLIAVLIFGIGSWSAGAETTAGMGVVSGQVNYCGKGGVAGMQVYVPGRQFVVITGADGKFLFDQLPAGEYKLKFKLGPQVFKHDTKVYVFKQRVSELGEVALCGSGDVVGTSPAVAPAMASPAPSTPAPAVQQKKSVKQSSVAGVCTEGTVVNITHGVAECKGSKLQLLSCQKGFGDCDGKIENGCEINLMEDNDHCGSCGNACSMLETCTLGSC